MALKEAIYRWWSMLQSKKKMRAAPVQRFPHLDSDSDWTIRGDRGCDEVLGRKKAISPCGSSHPAATSPTGTIGVSA